MTSTPRRSTLPRPPGPGEPHTPAQLAGLGPLAKHWALGGGGRLHPRQLPEVIAVTLECGDGVGHHVAPAPEVGGSAWCPQCHDYRTVIDVRTVREAREAGRARTATAEVV